MKYLVTTINQEGTVVALNTPADRVIVHMGQETPPVVHQYEDATVYVNLALMATVRVLPQTDQTKSSEAR